MVRSIKESFYCAYIDGKWIKGSQELVSINPTSVQDIVCRFSEAGSEHIRQAARAARSVQKKWAETPAPIRGAIIQNFGRIVESNKEALAKIVTREIGKPLRESLGSVQEVVDTCNFFVSEGRRLYGQTVPSEMKNKELFTYRRPVGVFGCMTACNFPLAVPAWYFVPALVSGNTCVWKPSEDALLCAYYFTEMLEQAGLPSGVFNVIFGRGQTVGAAMVDMIDEGLFDKFGFTGSTAVGRRIGEVCGRNLQVPCLELGGKNPLIVCEDADLDLALKGTLFSGFGTGGQRCTSLGNLIVHKAVYNEFVERLIQATEKIVIGDPNNAEAFYGPLMNERFMKNHLDHLSQLISPHHELPLGKGGRIGFDVDWKNFIGKPENGYFARPNIVLGVKKEDLIYSTETFGPLFNVLKYTDISEAISLANDTGYGLSSAIYTNNPYYVYKFKTEISAGMSSINNSTTGAEAHLPFGGNGKSGNGGRQSGIWVIDTFTKWQAVNWDFSGRLQLAQMETDYIEPNLDFKIEQN